MCQKFQRYILGVGCISREKNSQIQVFPPQAGYRQKSTEFGKPLRKSLVCEIEKIISTIYFAILGFECDFTYKVLINYLFLYKIVSRFQTSSPVVIHELTFHYRKSVRLVIFDLLLVQYLTNRTMQSLGQGFDFRQGNTSV